MSTSKKMLLSVHKKMLAKDLKGIVNLPNYDDNQPVEIMVSPAVEKKTLTREERKQVLKEIREIMAEGRKNNPEFDSNKTLDEYRMERLEEKYGPFN